MYIRGFDGLRAVAVLLVFLTHKTAWGADSKIGYSGVWLFLLLSGFLIAGQLQAGRAAIEDGRSGLGRELWSFWVKRALRILPAYYALILLLVPFYLSTGRPVPGLAWYLVYLSNIYFQLRPPEFLTTWAHFWTLAVEQQFYVLFAPLMLLVPLRHAAAACLAVVALSLVQRAGLTALGTPSASIYIDSLVNFGILSLGAALAVERDRAVAVLRRAGLADGPAGWVALFCLVASVPLSERFAGGDEATLQACFVLAVPMAALLLMLVLAGQASGLVRVLEGRFLAGCGRVSYGLYLYNDYIKDDLPERLLRAAGPHLWPSGAPGWVVSALAADTLGSRVLGLAGLLTCFVVLLAVANLSWAVVESPALRLKRHLTAIPLRAHGEAGAWPALDGMSDLPDGFPSTAGPGRL